MKPPDLREEDADGGLYRTGCAWPKHDARGRPGRGRPSRCLLENATSRSCPQPDESGQELTRLEDPGGDGPAALHADDASAQFYGGVQVGVQAQPQYVQQQPQYVQQRPVRMGRLRYGFDLGAGYMFAGGLRGASIVGSFRLGGQINDQLAVYYQGTLPIGSARLNCVGGVGAYFGIQARLNLTLFAASSGQDTRRYGFRIGVSSHTSFIGSGVFQFLDLHLGYEWF